MRYGRQERHERPDACDTGKSGTQGLEGHKSRQASFWVLVSDLFPICQIRSDKANPGRR